MKPKEGKENPFWRGVEIKRKRNYNWNITRREVLKRDKFYCQNCNFKGKLHVKAGEMTLTIHHINGYRYETGNKDELNKLITLCKACHGVKEWELHKNVNQPRLRWQEEKEFARLVRVVL